MEIRVKLPLTYEKLPDGTETGRFGSAVFICRRGVPVSLPFHEITPAENGYVGRLGSIEYPLDREGRIQGPFRPDSYCDIAKAVVNRMMETYLENARADLLSALKEGGSDLVHYCDRAGIRATYLP